MTTAVKVDAHAGWPVLVITQSDVSNGAPAVEAHIVEPKTERIFYIHSTLKILSVSEQPLPNKED